MVNLHYKWDLEFFGISGYFGNIVHSTYIYEVGNLEFQKVYIIPNTGCLINSPLVFFANIYLKG